MGVVLKDVFNGKLLTNLMLSNGTPTEDVTVVPEYIDEDGEKVSGMVSTKMLIECKEESSSQITCYLVQSSDIAEGNLAIEGVDGSKTLNLTLTRSNYGLQIVNAELLVVD